MVDLDPIFLSQAKSCLGQRLPSHVLSESSLTSSLSQNKSKHSSRLRRLLKKADLGHGSAESAGLGLNLDLPH